MNDNTIIPAQCTHCGALSESLISAVNIERPIYECECCGRFFRANANLDNINFLRTTAEIAGQHEVHCNGSHCPCNGGFGEPCDDDIDEDDEDDEDED